MPVLTKEATSRKIILPSSEKKDEAWVEVASKITMDQLLQSLGDVENPADNIIKCLHLMIKSWNFTDAKGKKLEVTEEHVRMLSAIDSAHIIEETGLMDIFTGLTKQKKRR